MSRIRQALVALALLGTFTRSSFANGSPATSETTLPLHRLATGQIIVPVTIGQQKDLPFIIDSGANVSVISEETRAALGFRSDQGMAVKGQGVGGSLSNARLLPIAKFSIGAQEYSELVVGVLDLRPFAAKLSTPIAGILGQNFLTKSDVEIDFDASLLRFSSPGSVPAPRGFNRVKIDRSHNQLLIDARLEGVSVAAILDIGAGQSAINWKAATAVGVTRSSPGLKKAPPVLGADNRLIEAVARKFGHVQIAGVDFPDPTIVIADLPIFEAIGLADRPSMVLGIEQLGGRKIVLKLANNELLIGPFRRRRLD